MNIINRWNKQLPNRYSVLTRERHIRGSLKPFRRRQSQSGNSILWSPETDSGRTLRESLERDCCESRARSVMIFMAWDLSSGPARRPDIPRVIRSENGRFEYFGKRASCIFYSCLCPRVQDDRETRDAGSRGGGGGERPVADFSDPRRDTPTNLYMIPLREVKG